MSKFIGKAPCANCPFLKEVGFVLRKGRRKQIADGLENNDYNNFLCHKTLGSEEEETEDLEGSVRTLQTLDSSKICAGSASVTLKDRNPSIALRLLVMSDKSTLELAENPNTYESMDAFRQGRPVAAARSKKKGSG